MKHKNLLSMTFFCGSLLAFAAGCTHLISIPAKPTTLPTGGKLPLHAVLVLDKDLTGYKYECDAGVDRYLYLFGPLLEAYARHVASASFQQVDEVTSLDNAFANSSADIVLIPSVLDVNRGFGWSKSNFTFPMEWIAKDRASQRKVWRKRITADVSESLGGAGYQFTGNKHRRIEMQKVIDDLSIKTYDAFQKAPELRVGKP
jgi:hypothetical protein